jgi:bacterioferritin-associated ferredoxin
VVICHCRAVSDQVLRGHMLAGVRDERDLIVCSGAGSRCGGCLPHLRQLLAEQQAAQTPAESAAAW